MKKALYLSIALVLTACGQDDLDKIKNEAISSKNAMNWAQAAERFNYCSDDTKKWTFDKDNPKTDRKIAVFTCNLNDVALSGFYDPKALTSGTFRAVISIYEDKKIQNSRGAAREEIEVVFSNGKSQSESGIGSGNNWLEENKNPVADIPKPFKLF